RRGSRIRVDTSALEDSLKRLLNWCEELTVKKFEVLGGYLVIERVATPLRESDKHCRFEKKLMLGAEVVLQIRFTIGEFVGVIEIPVLIPLCSVRRKNKLASEGLNVFAKGNTAF